MSQIKYPFALELTSPFEFSEVFNLPTLHIIISEREDGSLRGHCLDFDTWAYSESVHMNGIVRIITRLLEMALISFIDLYQENRLDFIYENEVTDESTWREYRDLIKKNRIANVKKSMEAIHSERMKISNKAIDSVHSDGKNSYDFSEFSDLEKKQIDHWFRELEKADVERRKEILHEMLKAIAQKTPLLKLVLSEAA